MDTIAAMAQLPAGVQPTPYKDRLKTYRAELEKRGGRRINADIEAEAAKALAAIMERDQLTARDAISKALITYSKMPG